MRVRCAAWLRGKAGVEGGEGGLCGPMVHVPFFGGGAEPVFVPGEAPRRLQPRGDTAGRGEDRLCRRGGTDAKEMIESFEKKSHKKKKRAGKSK